MTRPEPVPLSGPDLGDAEIEAVSEVLRSGRLSLGPRLVEFELSFADAVGVRHAVAVSSGTSALHLALLALGLGAGDEVITTSFSFIASANCILYVGATPVFVDVDPETLNLDPTLIEAAITPRTKAILVVHVFGRPAAMTAISEIARRHGLKLIEDACEALGAEVAGRPVGGLADVGTFGFYPNKMITTGEGGMLTTDDDGIARRARRLRNQGRDPETPWLEHLELGFNYRLSEIACALGLVQLGRLRQLMAARALVARRYHEVLHDHPRLLLPPPEPPGDRISWFVYVLRLTGDAAPRRDEILGAMGKQGIACGRYFPAIHLQPVYREAHGERSLPVTESAAEAVLALPFFGRLPHATIDRVAHTLKRLLA